jgi:hypothetical protein
MGTIKKFSDGLPDLVSEVIKQQLLAKLPTDLLTRLTSEGGDIVVNNGGKDITIVNCSPDLNDEIRIALN